LEDTDEIAVPEAATIDLDTPKAPRPRPKNSGAPPRPHYFPRPVRFKMKAQPFFHYWHNLSEECRGRTMVYVYSVYPVMDPFQVLTPEELREVEKQKRRAPSTNIDKPDAPFDPEEWETEVLRRYGSGTYHFKLNDSGISGNPQFPPKQMCTTDFELNHPDFQPVRDWRKLDMAHPANHSLIVNLRARGIRLPGDDLTQLAEKEEDELAQIQSIEKLTDAVVTMAKEKAATPPQSIAPDVQGLAGAKAVESVAEGAKQGFAIMSEAIQRANEVQAKNQDPKEYLKDLRDMVTIMQPQTAKPDTSGTDNLMRMMQMQHEAHMADMASVRAQLAAAETRNQSLLDKLISKPEAGDKPRSFIQEIKALAEGKEALADFFGMGSEKEDDTPWWARTIERTLEVLPDKVNTFMGTLAAMRAGSQPPIIDGQPQPGQAAIEPAKPSGPDAMIVSTLEKLKPAILQCLQDGTPGSDFAAALINETKSEQLYQFMTQQGKAGLFTLMQKHQELWAATRPSAQRLESFADEFLDVDRVKRTLEAGRAAQKVKPNGAAAGRVIIDPATGAQTQTAGPRIVND
jgi:hypothetical protein